MVSIFFLPYMSPNRESSGVEIAPTSSVAVNTHDTAATEVCRSAIMRGISGRTIVCCNETTSPAEPSAKSVSPVLAFRGASADAASSAGSVSASGVSASSVRVPAVGSGTRSSIAESSAVAVDSGMAPPEGRWLRRKTA